MLQAFDVVLSECQAFTVMVNDLMFTETNELRKGSAEKNAAQAKTDQKKSQGKRQKKIAIPRDVDDQEEA